MEFQNSHFQEEKQWASYGEIIAKVFNTFKIASPARRETVRVGASGARMHERGFHSRAVLRTLPHPIIVRRLPEFTALPG